jgi:hypothetical protein
MNGRLLIPSTIIGLLARIFDACYSTSDLVALFLEAGASGDNPYYRSKKQMITDWLSNTNNAHPEPIAVLNSLLKPFMSSSDHSKNAYQSEVKRALADARLRYVDDFGILSSFDDPSTPILSELLRAHNFPAVRAESIRATEKVDSEPREAASAAANILQAICKEYIVQNNLQMPTKQDLTPVFALVRNHLGLDAANVADDDIKRILGGLTTTVDGIAALRTHASSAHAQGTSKSMYVLEPRFSRLAVTAAHALVTLIIESWQAKIRMP